MDENYLLISGLQHFAFCRRQWALIHIEQQWNENQLTAEGRADHKNVHSVGNNTVRNGIITMRGLQVKSDVLKITGVCDAVEFTQSDNGVHLNKHSGLWSVAPVEYKRGVQKTADFDRKQLAAQVICLEEMFCCDIPFGYLFYFETRRREKVNITAELRKEVSDMVCEMNSYFSRGITPLVKTGPKCKQCSLKDICLPEIIKEENSSNVMSYIASHMNEGAP